MPDVPVTIFHIKRYIICDSMKKLLAVFWQLQVFMSHKCTIINRIVAALTF